MNEHGTKLMLAQLLKNKRENLFVNHVKNHLDKNQVVICKICNKSVDEIFDLFIDEVYEDLKTQFKGSLTEDKEE